MRAFSSYNNGNNRVREGAASDGGALRRERASKSVSVVCLGWFGCKEKHLLKYSELWKKLGVTDVIVYRPSPQAILFPSKSKEEAETFLKQVPPLKDNVIYHLFSLGGFAFYGQLLLNSHCINSNHNPREDVVGIIFDCGPPTRLTPKNALAGILTGLVVPDEDLAHQLYEMAWFRGVWNTLWSRYKLLVDYDAWYSATINIFNKYGPTHQLYLYTHQDKILSPESIDEFIQQQECLDGSSDKRRISLKKWTTGKHVQLLRQHPKDYMNEVTAFLENILIEKAE